MTGPDSAGGEVRDPHGASDPYSPTDPYAQPYPGAYGQAPYGQAPYGASDPYGYAPPPYGQPGPYPPGYYGAPYAVPLGTNGLAIASLVLGVVWLYWIGSILAIVFGFVARSQIRRTGQSGDGLAIAGLVLGIVGVGLLVLFGIGIAVDCSNGSC